MERSQRFKAVYFYWQAQESSILLLIFNISQETPFSLGQGTGGAAGSGPGLIAGGTEGDVLQSAMGAAFISYDQTNP